MDAQFSATDHDLMARAVRLARRGWYSTQPNPSVGCVLAKDDHIVGQGWHRKAGEPHAEIEALRGAGEHARGAACYVTLEPCCHHGRTPPCTDALIAAGVRRVVAAMIDPDPRVAGQGLDALREADMHVEVGLMEAAARRLNRGYARRMQRGVPYVRLKLAISVDGRTAMASGESQWITSDWARADVQRLRARACAIVTGIGTVLADNPSLTVRDARFETFGRQPARVVLDTHLRTPPEARMLAQPGRTLIFTGASADGRRRAALERAGAEIATPGGGREGKLDIAKVLRVLAQMQINEVLVEAGPALSGAFIEQALFDELIVYAAPRLLGESARAMAAFESIGSLAQAPRLVLAEARAVGKDLRLTLLPGN